MDEAHVQEIARFVHHQPGPRLNPPRPHSTLESAWQKSEGKPAPFASPYQFKEIAYGNRKWPLGTIHPQEQGLPQPFSALYKFSLYDKKNDHVSGIAGQTWLL